MDKWADYLISEVCYAENHKYIKKVKRHLDNGDSVGAASIVTRETVISDIEKGYTYCTIYKGNDKWNKGEDVRVITVKGEKYIRTDSNEIEKYNLGELPEFEC